MKTMLWLLIALLFGLAVLPTPVGADTTTIELGTAEWLVGLLVVTDAVSLVANTVVVVKGDGSIVMGWIGVVAGAGTIVVGSLVDDNGWILIAGGAVGGALGVWSMELACRWKRELGTHRLEFGPGVARRIDGTAEARMTMTLRF